jgi:anthranilate synthase component I
MINTMNPSKTGYIGELQQIGAVTVLSVISDIDTPVSVFNKICASSECAFLFESTEGDSRLARFSFIGHDPKIFVTLGAGTAEIRERDSGTTTKRQFDDPLKLLQGLLSEFASDYRNEKLPFPFTGGLVGYMGYGATQYFERIKQQDNRPYAAPEAAYGLYDSVIIFDHQYRKLSIVSRRGETHARDVLNCILRGDALKPIAVAEDGTPDAAVYDGVEANMTKQNFFDMVKQSHEYIKEGQVFQIVVSQRFSTPVAAPTLDVYRVLQSINPSPYAYFLKMPDFDYIGSSPETFVRCNNNIVMLRAIAGTRPRGSTDQEDALLAIELKNNEKEMAEHRMLVDLGRNDLGRVCKVGTINVGEIAELVKYRHVMHLATEITGVLSEEKTCFDAFRGCFPRGTVSGAPKVRAMQLLAQMEPEQRGIYSGVVGYFDFDGNMDGAIAIRSTFIKDGTAHVNAGAGVVLDSTPEGEYEETRNKARSVLKAIKLADAAGRQ